MMANNHFYSTCSLFTAAILFLLSPALAFGQGNSAQVNYGARGQSQSTGPQARTAANPDQRRRVQHGAAQAPFTLTPAEEEYRNQILDYWQQSSSQYRNFRCSFRRLTYDSSVVNYRDPQSQHLAAAEIATGEIFFSAPEHGRYETKQVWTFAAPPKSPGEQADYKREESPSAQDKWICDGSMIYEFDFGQKRLYETEIPQQMRGKQGLAASPIPFLFGAEKEMLLRRYWVSVVTPQGVEGEYWLKVVPKRAEDARNYKSVEIVIDEADFLPKGMRMFSPQYDPAKGNFANKYFEFKDRKVDTLALGNLFLRPSKPIGWTRQKRSFLADQ